MSAARNAGEKATFTTAHVASRGHEMVEMADEISYSCSWEKRLLTLGTLLGTGVSLWYTTRKPPDSFGDYFVNAASVALSAYYGFFAGMVAGAALDERRNVIDVRRDE